MPELAGSACVCSWLLRVLQALAGHLSSLSGPVSEAAGMDADGGAADAEGSQAAVSLAMAATASQQARAPALHAQGAWHCVGSSTRAPLAQAGCCHAGLRPRCMPAGMSRLADSASCVKQAADAAADSPAEGERMRR